MASNYVMGITDEPEQRYEKPTHEEREYDPKRLERMEQHQRHLAELRRMRIMCGEQQ